MKRLSRDVYIAMVLLFISGVVLWETSSLNKMSAVFPRTIGYILLVLSLYYLVFSLFKPNYDKVFATIDKKRVSTICFSFVGYTFFIWLIGFLLASLIFMFVTVWYLQNQGEEPKRKTFRAGFCSLLVTFGFYSLFKFIFVVPLPAGIIFG